MDLSALLLKSRQILKAIKGEADDSNPPVPQPPADESRLDPRAEGGEPTDKKVEDASADKGEGAGEDPDALGAGEGSEAGEGAGNAPDADAGEGEGGDGNGGAPEDYEDLDPEATREAKKALGLGAPVGHPGPDDLGPEGLPPEGDGDDLLTEIMNMIRDQSLVIRGLQEELARLKGGVGDQAKELKKALDEAKDLREQIASLHVTAPAEQPRAIQKALDTPASNGITRAEVMELARTASLPPLEIALLNTQARD